MRIALAVSCVLLPALFWVRFDTRPAVALPANTPEARRFAQLSTFLSSREAIVFMHCGDANARDEFYRAIAKWDFGDWVLGASREDGEALVEQTLALWPKEDFAGLQALFAGVDRRVAALRAQAEALGGSALLAEAQRDPLGLGRELLPKLKASTGAISLGPDLRLIAGGCHVAFLLPKKPSTDRPFVRALAESIQHLGVPAVGPHLYAAEYDQRLSRGLWLSGALSVLAVVALCYLLFRDVVAMLLIGFALAVASGWTLGAATLLLGPLQILAVSAASILPAVGIDAGIQFYVHRRMIRAIYIAALASGLGFATLVLAETRAFQQFGALLALGVAANTMAMATLLPALFRLAERLGWRPRSPTNGIVERAGSVLGRLPKPAALALLVGPLVALGFAFSSPPQQLGFAALSDRTLDVAQAQRLFEKLFGASDRHLFVASEAANEGDAVDLQKQLQIGAMTEAGITVEGGPLLWITDSDRARAAEWRRRLDPPATSERLASALRHADFNVAPFEKGLNRLALLGTAQPQLPPLAQLAHRQRVGPVGDKYWALTSLFVSADVDGPAVLGKLREALPASSHVVGPFALDLELRESLLADGRLLAGLAIAAVMLALLAARMRMRQVLSVLSALAVIFGGLWLTLGALHIPITLVTLLVVPFVLGIGIDASVYLAEHDAFSRNRESLLRDHLRSLLGSTLTTLAGFLCLRVVALEQIQLLGTAVALGLVWALLVALLWIPLFVPATFDG